MPGEWSRLAQHVVSRRRELGYLRQIDLAKASTLGMRTLGSIETGERTQYNRSTLAALEQGLQWEPGSIDAVLDGDEPTPREDQSPADNVAQFDDTPPGLSEREEKIWAALRDAGETRERRWQLIAYMRGDTSADQRPQRRIR